MEYHPKVSILTTVYNREKYIGACIESVIKSTFQNWEMIIVDDKSSDDSVRISRQYEAKDSRIKVFENTANLGDYHNRNKAASYAKGTFIKYLDADDLIYPHGLEIMVNTMEQFPMAVLGISQEVAEDYLPYPFLMEPKETFQREFLKRGVLNFGPTGAIMRRKEFEDLGKFTGTRYIGDTEMWYKMALQYPIVKMVPGLTFWRQHEEQEIMKEKGKGIDIIKMRYSLADSTLKNPHIPLTNQELDLAQVKLKRRFGRHLFKMLILRGKFLECLKVMQSCDYSLMELLRSMK